MKGFALVELLAALLIFALLLGLSQQLLLQGIDSEFSFVSLEDRIEMVESLNHQFFNKTISEIRANAFVSNGLGNIPSGNPNFTYFYHPVQVNLSGVLCVQFSLSGNNFSTLRWVICRKE